jgi:hypothetical protein
VARIKIHAHTDLGKVATMNDDSSTFELPEYIHQRLYPQILVADVARFVLKLLSTGDTNLVITLRASTIQTLGSEALRYVPA